MMRSKSGLWALVANRYKNHHEPCHEQGSTAIRMKLSHALVCGWIRDWKSFVLRHLVFSQLTLDNQYNGWKQSFALKKGRFISHSNIQEGTQPQAPKVRQKK